MMDNLGRRAELPPTSQAGSALSAANVAAAINRARQLLERYGAPRFVLAELTPPAFVVPPGAMRAIMAGRPSAAMIVRAINNLRQALRRVEIGRPVNVALVRGPTAQPPPVMGSLATVGQPAAALATVLQNQVQRPVVGNVPQVLPPAPVATVVRRAGGVEFAGNLGRVFVPVQRLFE